MKFNFTSIRGLPSNFIEYKSFLELNFVDVLALCDTNIDYSIDSGNFSVTGYFPLIWKDSVTHKNGLAVYVKEGHPFARDLFLEYSAGFYLYFRMVLLHSVVYFFFLYQSHLSFGTVFDAVLFHIDEVLLINSSPNVFIFGDFNVYHKDW